MAEGSRNVSDIAGIEIGGNSVNLSREPLSDFVLWVGGMACIAKSNATGESPLEPAAAHRSCSEPEPLAPFDLHPYVL